MIEGFYPDSLETMSQYNEHDWVPASASVTALNQLSHCIDNSYLTPQMSCADLTSFPNTPAISRPRSSAGFDVQELDSLNRPRSQSAGLYNAPPQIDQFSFASSSMGLGKQDMVEDLHFTQSPVSMMRSPLVTNRPPLPYSYHSMPIPERHTQRLKPVPIASNPVGLNHLKRGREEQSHADASPKRRRRSSLKTPILELTEEERLLLRLKDEINIPWKDIALRFQLELGRSHQVPALQMRYKRLHERLRVWTETDVQALQQAHDYWEKFKWDIIATKMLDFGCGEKWPAKYCIRKWEELHPDLDMSKERSESERASPNACTPRPQ